MGLYYQSDLGLSKDIRAIGCEYLCCAAMATDYTDKGVPITITNNIWNRGLQEKWVDSKLGLHKPTSYRRLFGAFGAAVGVDEFVGDQVGSIINGRVRFWDWWHSNEFTHIIRRVYSSYQDKHSTLLNEDFETIFDPAPWFSESCVEGLYLFYLGNKDSFEYRELGSVNA